MHLPQLTVEFMTGTLNEILMQATAQARISDLFLPNPECSVESNPEPNLIASGID